MSSLLVVVGATGLQGRSVINWFQQNKPSWKIRGLTRNPHSEAAVALAKSGIEVVRADLNNLESLQSAFQSAKCVFAYTDFGGIVGGPDVMGKFKDGQLKPPVGAESFKIEVQHGGNVADAAATVRGLERLVWSAMADAKKWSKGKYTQVFHFDAKAAVTDYMLGLKALEGKVSMVQLGIFMNNVAKGLEMFALRMTDDGTTVWQPPFPGDLPLPWIDIEKDLGAFVNALVKAPAPTQVLAVSEWVTCRKWLETWSAITGAESHFEEARAEVDTTEDPSGLTLQFSQTAKFVIEFGFTGGDPEVLLPEALEKEGFRIVRSGIAGYIAREDWSKIVS